MSPITLKRTISLSHKSSVKLGGSIEANSIEVGGNVQGDIDANSVKIKGRHTGSINV